jgi:hypothetical protein
MDTDTVERIRELLERNLQEVFGEGDDDRRRIALDALWAEDGVLYVPSGPVVGRVEINRAAGALRATHPDFVYTPSGSPQVVHNAGRLAWGSGTRGDVAAYTGWDFVLEKDGKIAALYVFLDEASEEFRRTSGKLTS